MFKKHLLLLYSILISCSLSAQVFNGGINIGLSSSQVGGDNLAGFNKAGFLAGAFINTKIEGNLKIQMEMNYIEKGSNNPDMNENRIEDISLSYLEIPVLLQYGSINMLKIETGFLFGILIDGYYNNLSGRMENQINPFTEYDFGALIGMDYKISDMFSLNTRLSNSFLPIGREDYDNTQVHGSWLKGKYNSVLSFSIHYNL